MSKSLVLRALKILGLEEILKLAQVLKAQPSQLKKAAGEELISWSDAPEESPVPTAHAEEVDNVIPFQKSTKSFELNPIDDPNKKPTKPKPEEESSNFYSSEFLLWQRELSKESEIAPSKEEAAKGYSKGSAMYIVKTPSDDGKEKIRFASTNGVLVNKKQA